MLATAGREPESPELLSLACLDEPLPLTIAKLARRSPNTIPPAAPAARLVSGGAGSLYFFVAAVRALARAASSSALVQGFPALVALRLSLGAPLLRFLLDPSGFALFQDSGEEHVGGLVVAAFLSGQLGLRGHEPPFNRRLQHRGTVALQVPLNALQGRHGVVEAGEVGVDGLDDASLLSWSAERRGRSCTGLLLLRCACALYPLCERATRC